jgi:putative hemolysin
MLGNSQSQETLAQARVFYLTASLYLYFMILSLIATIIALLFIAFFSGIEIAFVSTNRLGIELKRKQGKRSGIILSQFMENPARFITTCLVGFNLFLVIFGSLISGLLQPVWQFLQIDNEYVRLAVVTLLSSFIVLVLGEFIPKAIFRAKNSSLLHFFANTTRFFYWLFQPLTVFFVGSAKWILKYIFDINLQEKNEAFNKTDLEFFYQQTKESTEENTELNKELFENALMLPNLRVRECLVPRKEIIGVPTTISIEELRNKFVETKLSKLIVYQNNIDNILGYVHQLDLFKKPQQIDQIILPIPAIPESMPAIDLITKLNKEKRSMAWVVDEFGGTSGIITLEDVIEEIVGEIQDEYDTEELVEKKLSETEFMFAGRSELDYITEKYEIDFEENDAETLSGYIIEKHEAIPTINEKIIIGNYEFTIMQVSDTRIETVKMRHLNMD